MSFIILSNYLIDKNNYFFYEKPFFKKKSIVHFRKDINNKNLNKGKKKELRVYL